VASAWGGWIGGFGLQQAQADLAAVLVDPLDHVPIELKLADDDGGEVNAAGAQLVKRDRLGARAPQSLEHPQLLGCSRCRHRQDASPRFSWGRYKGLVDRR
jgi:hypothetical protein